MNDRRDLPFIYLLTYIHVLVLPVSILLFANVFSSYTWGALALVYLYISQIYFKARFGLMLHCICHRKLFKKKYQWLFRYINWIICPLFGHSPETYFSHHMGMHHYENNTARDGSSTLMYQRDDAGAFLLYFLNFLFLGVSTTFSYLHSHGRKKMYLRFMFGELSFYAFCIIMCFIDIKATVVVFIFPFLLARFEMMVGNWTQHAFVDSASPGNIYTNSINCINTRFNKACWNDGYHTIHHLKPGLHYTQMPTEFLRMKDAFVKNRSLVFDGAGYILIFYFLLTKQYNRLANHVVNIDGMFRNNEEAIALMKSRTRKIKVED